MDKFIKYVSFVYNNLACISNSKIT